MERFVDHDTRNSHVTPRLAGILNAVSRLPSEVASNHKGTAHLLQDIADANVEPDAFDGGCPQDVYGVGIPTTLAKRPVAPVSDSDDGYKTILDEIRHSAFWRGMMRAAEVLEKDECYGMAQLVRDEATKYAAENGVQF